MSDHVLLNLLFILHVLCRAFYLFCATSLIIPIIQEYECKIIFII